MSSRPPPRSSSATRDLIMAWVGGGLGLMISWKLVKAWRLKRRLKEIPTPPLYPDDQQRGGLARLWSTYFSPGHELLVWQAGGMGKLLLDVHEKYGHVVRLIFGGEVYVSIDNPEMLSELPIHKLEKRVDGLNFLRGVLGPRSVGFKKGGDAKERRQILHDLFTQQSLNQLMPAFCETIVTSVAAWSDHPSPLEAQGKARRLWMDLNALNVFGTGQDTVELCEKFSEALGLLLEARFGPPIVPLTKRWWNLQRALNELHAGVDRIIETHLQHRRDNPGASQTKDLLSLLLRQVERDPQRFTYDDVHDEVTTFLFATYENYVVLSNTLYHLGNHPDIQSALRDQANTQLGPSSLPAAIEDLHKVPLARAIIKESLRITQVGGNTWRVTRGTHRVGPYTLPSGTSLIVPMVAIHKSPKVWSNPDRFDPSRFDDTLASSDANRRAVALSFIPFGFGTRMCLGYRFATDISALVMVLICQRYKVETVGEPPEWKESTFNWYSGNGLNLRLHPIQA